LGLEWNFEKFKKVGGNSRPSSPSSALTEFYSLAKKDAVLKQAIHDYYGMRGYREPTFFQTIVICIVEQQLNLRVSKKIRELLIKNFGEKLEINNQIYYAFPRLNFCQKLT